MYEYKCKLERVIDGNTIEAEIDLGFNDIAGQAYFVRAWSYFSLVRLYGDIPLWLTLPDSNNTS